jgi:flagellar protein FlaJ
MSFIKSLLRQKSKSSFEPSKEGRDPSLAQTKSGWLLDLDGSQLDLVTVLTYLSCISTANVTREQLFEAAARLEYMPSPYFAQVANLVQSLGYDFSHACHVVANGCPDEVMKQFLLRMGNSMASGEAEPAFLVREMGVQLEDYTNAYERDIETLRKWTDAFIALMVSCNLIVLVSLISNMIYNLGSTFIVVVEIVSLAAAALGAWVIYRIAPFDPLVHKLPYKCDEQRLIRNMAMGLFPAAAISALLAFGVFHSMGAALLIAGLLIIPVGVVTLKLESKVESRDRDIADFLRALGGVTSARSSTVIESLHHIDRRAIGSLETELKRLLIRVAAGLSTMKSWARFMAETGSELIHRTVRSFWDACDLGGDADKIGRFSSDMAMRVSLLRAKRKLVSTTFNYVVIPMHVALIGTLVFMAEVVAAFNDQLVKAQETVGGENTTTINPEDIGIPGALTFQSFNTEFMHLMIMIVVIALTLVNGFAPRAASGGHGFKFAFFGGLTMVLSGAILLIVPPIAAGLFSDTLTSTAAPPA